MSSECSLSFGVAVLDGRPPYRAVSPSQRNDLLPKNRNVRFGFTLVELLVVIGIIALLISILLPALSKARKSANTTKCLAMVRELGNAWQMYTQAHKGKSIPYYLYDADDNLGLWIGQLRSVYSNIDKSRLC